jgi:hypothetical protein
MILLNFSRPDQLQQTGELIGQPVGYGGRDAVRVVDVAAPS